MINKNREIKISPFSLHNEHGEQGLGFKITSILLLLRVSKLNPLRIHSLLVYTMGYESEKKSL